MANQEPWTNPVAVLETIIASRQTLNTTISEIGRQVAFTAQKHVGHLRKMGTRAAQKCANSLEEIKGSFADAISAALAPQALSPTPVIAQRRDVRGPGTPSQGLNR